MSERESLLDDRCPECGGARERDHCIEPGKRVGKVGCGWWKLAELCAEQTLDMRGWFDAAKQRHAALSLMIDEGDDYGDHVGVQRHRRAIYDGQAEILAMWEKALDA